MTNRQETPRSAGRHLAPWWALFLGVLLLGPVLGPGFLLSYDLVWVPDLAMRADFLGVGTALPRAVPSDAVVAVLDEVVPGMLLEKIVLLGALTGGGVGMTRVLREQSRFTQLVAVGFYVWSPFVVERLVLGAWPVLVGYAVLPWLLHSARQWRETGALPASLPLLVVLGSLSASAGLATGFALVAVAATRSEPRRWASLCAIVLAANAPWLVSGFLHLDSATSDPAGGRLFALADEGIVPGPLAALTGGGIWNDEVVPASRAGVLGVVAVIVFVVLAAAGVQAWVRTIGRRDALGWAACFALAWLIASFTWLAPGWTGRLAAEVPGGGLIRDGSRLLVLAAPASAAVLAMGAERLRDRCTAELPRMVLGAFLMVTPVLLMPDVAYGVGGRLDAVDYPRSYDEARSAVAGGAGDVLLLPLSSYRQPEWNNQAKVLNPLGRFLAPDYVASDELIVAGVTLRGEDPRVPEVRMALSEPTAQDRTAALAALGIGFVAVDPQIPVDTPGLDGEVLVNGPEVRLLRLDPDLEPRRQPAPTGWVVAMGSAWSAFLLLIALSPGLKILRGLHGKR